MIRNLIFAAAALACTPVLAVDGLRFGDIDSTLGIDAVASELDDVRSADSNKFARIVSGKDADGRSVLMGGDVAVEMMSVSWHGAVAINDFRSIGAIEKAFGLVAANRIIQEKCDPKLNADAAVICTQIDYGCTDGWCPIQILSFYADGRKESGTTRISWKSNSVLH